MRISPHVLQDKTPFDCVKDAVTAHEKNLVDGDWSLKYSFTAAAGASVGAICATTWVVVPGGRIYGEIGRGGAMKPRFFPGTEFPYGTEVLATPDEHPGDGAGGDEVEGVPVAEATPPD